MLDSVCARERERENERIGTDERTLNIEHTSACKRSERTARRASRQPLNCIGVEKEYKRLWNHIEISILFYGIVIFILYCCAFTIFIVVVTVAFASFFAAFFFFFSFRFCSNSHSIPFHSIPFRTTYQFSHVILFSTWAFPVSFSLLLVFPLPCLVVMCHSLDVPCCYCTFFPPIRLRFAFFKIEILFLCWMLCSYVFVILKLLTASIMLCMRMCVCVWTVGSLWHFADCCCYCYCLFVIGF